MKEHKIAIIALSTTVLISACTNSTTTIPNNNELATTAPLMSWSDRQHTLSTITAWQLQGAIGIQQDSKRWSASINWQQQNASNYKIRLYGPFGAGAVELQGQPGLVTLVSNNNPKPVTSNSPEGLIAKETGWQLPVGNLYYWVRSIPAPGSASQTSLDSANRLNTLQQDGWKVQYLDYAKINGVDLPDKMLLTNPPFTIKLVIKNWQLHR